MVYEERNTWAGLIVMIFMIPAYVIIVLQQAAGRPLVDVDWVPIMVWTIGISIVATIVLSIVWGIFAGMREPQGVGKSDQRDRDIAHMSSRVGQAFLGIAGPGVIALCAIAAAWLWLANARVFGFAVSALVGGIASVIAYRRGMA